MPTVSKFMTTAQVAKEFGVATATVANWADQGKLASHRTLGGHRRFNREDVLRLLEEQGSAA